MKCTTNYSDIGFRNGRLASIGLLTALVFGIFGALALSVSTDVGRHPDAGKAVVAEPAKHSLHDLAIPFVENRGQADLQVGYTAHTLTGTYYVMKSGDMAFVQPVAGEDSNAFAIRFRLEGARTIEPAGIDRSETRVGFMLGNDPKKWQTSVPTFNSVALNDVYDAIDLSLRARGNRVEQVFRVKPGANVDDIRIGIRGAQRLSIEDSGALAIHGSEAVALLSRPIAFQAIDGSRQPVKVAYVLRGNSYGFELGDYDRSRELVIDPLLQATYLGGRGGESVNVVTIHPTTGAVYIAGGTTSMSFGVDNPSLAHSNAYIAHLTADLTSMLFVQFMGGTGNEAVSHIAVHPAGALAGRMIVFGPTTSTDWPATGFGTQANDNMFIGDFGTDLQPHALRWISGSFNDDPSALAIHPASPYEVYIAGDTNSANFPGVSGGAQPAIAGVRDGFIARLNADVSSLLQSTFIGGANGSETDLVLALDPVQGVYVKGRTNAWDAWPTALTPPPAVPPQPAFGGGIEDLFVALLEADLTAVKLATFLGGNGEEDSKTTPLIVHPTTGKVYMTGNTTSNDSMAGILISPGGFLARFTGDLATAEAIPTISILSITDLLYNAATDNLYLLGTTGGASLPGSATMGRFQPAYGGGLSDGAIAMYNAGSTLQAATYLGGSDREGSLQLAIHPTTSDIYAAGYTWSTDFPMTAGGPQPVNAGFQDGFAVRMTPGLTAPAQATYFGGSNDDTVTALAAHPVSGDVYIAGFTESVDLPGTAGGAQPAMIMQPEAFVARYDSTLAGPDNVPDIQVIPTSHDFGEIVTGDSATITVTIANVGGADLTVTNAYISYDPTGWYSRDLNGPTNPCGAPPRVIPAGQNCTLTVTLEPLDFGTPSGRLTVVSDDPDTPAVVVDLIGRGIYPARIEVIPDALDWGIETFFFARVEDLVPGVPLETQVKNLHIANRGDVDLTIDRIDLQGDDAAEVVVDLHTCGPLPRVLVYNEECYVIVHWAIEPPSLDVWPWDDREEQTEYERTRSAELVIGSDDGERPEVPVPITVYRVYIVGTGDDDDDDWCFIATAAYGTAMHDDVQLLRDFRDRYLMIHAPGRAFVAFYYEHSPPIAAYIAEREWLRTLTRWALAPLVYGIKYPGAATVSVLALVAGLVSWRRRHYHRSLAST